MKKLLLNFAICVAGFMLFTLISTMAVTKFKPIFYYSIEKFNLAQGTEYRKEEMKENYSYVVDYLFSDEEFNLPTIKYSKEGASHFEDVRNLYALGEDFIVYCTAIILVLCFAYYRLFSKHEYLKYLGTSLIAVPVCSVMIISSNFNRYFTLFHKIFFNNDNWIFDPVEDPIINILPEEFFALCGIAIITLTVLIGAILIIVYRVNKKITVSRAAGVINN